MPYLLIRAKNNFTITFTLLIGAFVFAMFFTLFNKVEAVSAATSHCVIVADNKESAKYYPSGSTCGSGSGVTLNVRSSGASEGQYTFSNAGVNASCSGIETYALGANEVKYCVQYTPGQKSAYVARGSADGEFSTYNTDVKTNSEIKNEEDTKETIDTARQDAVFSAMGPSLSSLKNKFNSGCTANTSSTSGITAFNECVDNAWKKAIYTCFQSSLNLEEDQTRGSAEQTEQNHKDKFANCLAGKLNGVTAAGVGGLIAGVSISSTNAAANSAEEAATPTPETAEEDDEATSCAIEGMGWIICPALSFLGTVSDGAFSFLSTAFLETRSDVVGHDSVRAAWSAMRNIANVAFVIAFIIIIYSQLTSAGLGSYGVKKMLPRLIVAAILVNLSFIVCQVAVDLSNLLGYSLKSLFTEGLASIASTAPTGDEAAGAVLGGLGWGVLIAGLLAGGVTVILSISIPVLLAALLAILLIVLILVARTALIIILTIISPLAFVAYLLPNTEQWFKKWYKMFFALLMVFPIIGVVFGASALAGQVIYDTANGNMLMQLVGLGAAAIPLFLVPSLLKNSLNAAGSIGTKLSGMSSKATGRVGSRVKDSSQLGRRMQEYKSGRERSRAAKAIRSRNGRFGSGVDKVIGKIPGASGLLGTQRGGILAKESANKLFDEEVGLQQMALKGESESEWQKIMNDPKQSEHKRAAAAGMIMKSGSRKAQLEALESARNLSINGDKHSSSIQKQMAADMSSKPFAIGNASAAALRQGSYGAESQTLNDEFDGRLKDKLSADGVATMDIDELKRASAMANAGQLSAGALASLSSNISSARSDENIKGKISGEANAEFDKILEVANKGAVTTTTTPDLGATTTSGGTAISTSGITTSNATPATSLQMPTAQEVRQFTQTSSPSVEANDPTQVTISHASTPTQSDGSPSFTVIDKRAGARAASQPLAQAPKTDQEIRNINTEHLNR